VTSNYFTRKDIAAIIEESERSVCRKEGKLGLLPAKILGKVRPVLYRRDKAKISLIKAGYIVL
jgi:hypothetical protein